MDTESTDSGPADEELLRRLSSDPAAFELFYRRHVDRVIGFAARRVTDPADAADLVNGRRRRARESAALDRLRPRAREAVLLVSEAGLRPAEAARVLGISPAAFRMRLSGARRALDKAVAAGPEAGATRPPEDPITPMRNLHMKEAVS